MKIFAGMVFTTFLVLGASAFAGDYDPLTVTCTDYTYKDEIFGHRINAHQREQIALFVIGYAFGETKYISFSIDDTTEWAAELTENFCLQKDYSSLTVYEMIKSIISNSTAIKDEKLKSSLDKLINKSN